MPSLNQVYLIGHLGQDPTSGRTGAGTSWCNFRMATSYKGKDGEERTTWHTVVTYGKTADLCELHLTKGMLVHVDGSLNTRSWEQKGEKRYATEVVANRVAFFSDKSKTGALDEQDETDEVRARGASAPIADDGLPF